MSYTKMELELCGYNKSKKSQSKLYDLQARELEFDGITAKNRYKATRYGEVEGHELDIEIDSGKRREMGINVLLTFDKWTESNYVFSPSALYNGNRFRAEKLAYPPMLTRELAASSDNVIISDVPRLNINKGENSRVQLSVGDMATPCVGYYSEAEKLGFLMFFEQCNSLGDYGISLSESFNHDRMELRLMSPCVRNEKKYSMCSTDTVSDDRGVTLSHGDRINIKYHTVTFACENLAQYYRKFFENRKSFYHVDNKQERLPLSQAYSLISEKYNARNWLESDGFYTSSEASSSIYRQWQTGWVGGLMNTLPMYELGDERDKIRMIRTLDFVTDKLQAKSGFLYGIYCDGRPYGDSFAENSDINVVMTRKNADALYFFARHLIALKLDRAEINPKWEKSLIQLANAFVELYRKHGDIGQFINLESMDMDIGKTASAAIIGAGLCLTYKYNGNMDYLELAKEISQGYFDAYVSKGFTNGGPGEIAQCPDSESAFGMLESFVMLYECSGEDKWLKYSRMMAELCSSWCVSYDYKYSKNSQFAIRDIHSTGSVWASVQNKHSAPGICTLSGVSLFKLYRATNDIMYLELLKDIAHNITQYVNTKERPFMRSYIWHSGNAEFEKVIRNKFCDYLLKLKSKGKIKETSPIFKSNFNKYGCMDERVNLSDWEGKSNVGELPGGSCWCEVSTLLTYLEVPSIYVVADSNFVFTFDHVKCEMVSHDENMVELRITNPTQYDATYRIFAESEKDKNTPIFDTLYCHYENVKVEHGQSKVIKLETNHKEAVC